MADDPNEDSWLYGSNPEPPEDEDNKDVSTPRNDNAVDEDDKAVVVKESENAVSRHNSFWLCSVCFNSCRFLGNKCCRRNGGARRRG